MAAVKWDQVPEFYHKYLHQVKADDLASAFNVYRYCLHPLLSPLTNEQWDYRYAPGKWTIREMVQHIIDTERIFCYRALTIARKDTVALPGFNENEYAAASGASRRSRESLMAELSAVQESAVLLFGSFDEEMLAATGTANNNTMYVEGIGYILVGHRLHHVQVLQERYLGENERTP